MPVVPVSLASIPRCFGCRSRGNWLCEGCAGELQPPRTHEAIEGVSRASIPWAYQGTARDLILALKLRGKRPAAAVLAAAVAAQVHRTGSEAAVITWVPARSRDIRLRGFDHAELIARELRLFLGLPAVRLLERAMDAPDQTTLSGPARRANLASVFVARPGATRVMLVDDLVTTGATAAACASALRAAGAGVVEVAAPCRA